MLDSPASTINNSNLSSLFTGTCCLEPECKVLEDYMLGQRLGEGAYGSVYEVTHIPSGQRFALKILQKEDLFMATGALPVVGIDTVPGSAGLDSASAGGDGTNWGESFPSPLSEEAAQVEALRNFMLSVEANIIQEATVMQSLQHPHVVRFYKFLNSTVAFYFVMELASGGELFDLIISSGFFAEAQARRYFQELMSAIDYCHGQGVAHKDLKAENLLLSSDARLLICDFGFSSKSVKNIDDPEKEAFTFDDENNLTSAAQFGTLHYMSPEAVVASTANVFNDFSDSSPATQYNSPTYDRTMLGSPTSLLPREDASASAFQHGHHSRTASTNTANGSRAGAAGREHHHNGFSSKVGNMVRSFVTNGHLRSVKSSSALSEISTDSVDTPKERIVASRSEAELSGVGASNDLTRHSRKGDKKEKERTKKDKQAHTHTHHHVAPTLFKGKHSASPSASERVSPPSPPPPPSQQPQQQQQPKKVIVDQFMQDLWSCGVILFFMLTGRLPFDGRDDEETLHLIQRAEYHFTPEELLRISPAAVSLVRRMLALDPSDRLTVDQILANEWFVVNINYARDFPHREELASTQQSRNSSMVAGGAAGTLSSSGASSRSPSSFLDFSSAKHVVTREEEEVLDNAFHRIDCDGYGRITRDQVRDTLITLRGHEVLGTDVDELVALFTGDPNASEVTFAQFRDAWVKRDLAHTRYSASDVFQLANICGMQVDEVERKIVRQLRTAFNSVDTEHTGVIRADELRSVFDRCHFTVSEEEMRSLLAFFAEEATAPLNRRASTTTLDYCDSPSSCVSPTTAGGNARLYSNMYVGDTLPVLDPSDTKISFDMFVNGIVQKEILLRHPLGRRLAMATNLVSLFQKTSVNACLRHGFTVTGLQNVILEKLAGVPERLMLLYSDETVSNTENIYSFRYLGSSALLNGTKLDSQSRRVRMSASADNYPVTPFLPSHTNSELRRPTAVLPCLVSSFSAGGGEPASNAAAVRVQPAFSIGDILAHSLVQQQQQQHKQQPRDRDSRVSSTVTYPNEMSHSVEVPRSAVSTSSSHPPPPQFSGATFSHTTNRDRSDGDDDHDDEASGGARDDEGTHTVLSVSRDTSAVLFTNEATPTSNRGSPSDYAPSVAAVRTQLGSASSKSLELPAAESRGGKRRCSSRSDSVRSGTAAAGAPPPMTETRLPSPNDESSAPTSQSAQPQHQKQHQLPPTSPPTCVSTTQVPALAGATARNGERPPPPLAPLSSKPPATAASTTIAASSSGDSSHGRKPRPSLSISIGSPTSEVHAASPIKLAQRRLASYSCPRRRSTPLLFTPSPVLTSSAGPAVTASQPALGHSISITHRTLAFGGGSGAVAQVNGVCDVDIILAAAGLGYTSIKFRRIHGKTSDFHEAVAFISNLLGDEHQQAIEDTMARGESELM